MTATKFIVYWITSDIMVAKYNNELLSFIIINYMNIFNSFLIIFNIYYLSNKILNIILN